MADKKKKIMRSFKMMEISGVDVPAQEGAQAILMKRADIFEKASALTTKDDDHTHLMALNGPPDGVELNAGSTNYDETGHTHPWVRLSSGQIVIGAAVGRDGVSHTHEVASISKAYENNEKKRTKKEIEIEISSDDDDDDDDDLTDEEKQRGDDAMGKAFVDDAAAYFDLIKRTFTAEQRKKLAEEGKALPDGSFPIVTRSDLSNAIRAFGRAGNKAQAARHIKARAKALDASDMLPDDGLLAKNSPAAAAGDEVGKETEMTDKTKKAATVEELTAALDLANIMAAMSDMEKSYHGELKTDAEKAEFVAKSADERKTIAKAADAAKVAKAAELDPVAYTTLDGVELRKSAGDGFIAMAKSNDALRKSLEGMQEKNENLELAKRAETELSNLPGDIDTRVALLKSVEAIPDETQRAAAMNALKAQNTAMASAFVEKGHIISKTAPETPGGELEEMAKAHQAKNDGMTIEKAYAEVMMTAKGAELYKRAQN